MAIVDFCKSKIKIFPFDMLYLLNIYKYKSSLYLISKLTSWYTEVLEFPCIVYFDI